MGKAVPFSLVMSSTADVLIILQDVNSFEEAGAEENLLIGYKKELGEWTILLCNLPNDVCV